MAAALLVLVAVASLLVIKGHFGSLIRSGTDHPPYETLPSHAEASRAIKEHAALTEHISATGDNVHIVAATPCDDPDLALGDRQPVHARLPLELVPDLAGPVEAATELPAARGR